jgi:hypothetical protein
MVVAIRLILFDRDPTADTAPLSDHSPEWGKQRQDQTGHEGDGAGLGGRDEPEIDITCINGSGLAGNEQDGRAGENHQPECA